MIPKTLAENAGMDVIDILAQLRMRHSQPDGKWIGVDVNNNTIVDNYDAFVWEPTKSRINAYIAATEAACLILSIDETVKAPRPDQDTKMKKQGRGIRK